MKSARPRQDACEAGPGLRDFPELQAALSEAPAEYRAARRQCDEALTWYEKGYGRQGDIRMRQTAAHLSRASQKMSVPFE